mgnify:CR=1 FL=1
MTASVKKTILANLTTQHFFFISISCSLSCWQTQTSNFFAEADEAASCVASKLKHIVRRRVTHSTLRHKSQPSPTTRLPRQPRHHRVDDYRQHKNAESHLEPQGVCHTPSRSTLLSLQAVPNSKRMLLLMPLHCHCGALYGAVGIQADRVEARQASCSASSRPTVCEQEASQCGLGESL